MKLPPTTLTQIKLLPTDLSALDHLPDRHQVGIVSLSKASVCETVKGLGARPGSIAVKLKVSTKAEPSRLQKRRSIHNESMYPPFLIAYS